MYLNKKTKISIMPAPINNLCDSLVCIPLDFSLEKYLSILIYFLNGIDPLTCALSKLLELFNFSISCQGRLKLISLTVAQSELSDALSSTWVPLQTSLPLPPQFRSRDTLCPLKVEGWSPGCHMQPVEGPSFPPARPSTRSADLRTPWTEDGAVYFLGVLVATPLVPKGRKSAVCNIFSNLSISRHLGKTQEH